MFASAGFSFVLCFLVFLRLRGNISISTGYRVHFHGRPKVSTGRTRAGTYITAVDLRVESHLTTLAKQMLWYPLAYAILVLPIGATQFSTVSGASVSFAVTVFAAAVLVLNGFVNTVLFCTNRNALPGSWRQIFSTGPILNNRRSDIALSTWGNSPWRRTESGTRKGRASAGSSTFVIDISVEKDIEIKYDEESSVSSPKFGYPTSPAGPTSPLRAYGGGQRADAYISHIRLPPFPSLRDERQSVCPEGEGDHENSHLKEGVHSAIEANRRHGMILNHPLQAPQRLEMGISDPTMVLEPPASIYLLPSTHSVNTDTPKSWSHSVLTSDAAGNYIHLPGGSGDFGSHSDGMYWTRYNERPS